MSAKANQDDKSQNQQDPNEQSPKETAQEQVQNAGSELTQGQIIANSIDALLKANPNLTPEKAGALVLQAMRTGDTLEAKVEKEVSIIVPVPGNADTVFLKKDKKRRFPIERAALKGVIVRQTRTRIVDQEEVEVPARDLNEIGIYSEADFKEFSKKDGLFEQQKVNVEVWHKPGDEDTIQE